MKHSEPVKLSTQLYWKRFITRSFLKRFMLCPSSGLKNEHLPKCCDSLQLLVSHLVLQMIPCFNLLDKKRRWGSLSLNQIWSSHVVFKWIKLRTSWITCFWQNESSSDTALQCEMFRFFDISKLWYRAITTITSGLFIDLFIFNMSYYCIY